MTQADLTGASLATELGSPGSRALLIGTGRHLPGSQLPDVPAVSATIQELGRTLVDNCGLRPESLLPPLLDPRDPIEFGNAVVAAAKQAEDVLLLYYVGHGLVSPGNELYLATTATDDLAEGLAFKALPYQAVRDAFSNCRARSIIVVLDCCFAGRAHGSFGTAATDAFALASLSGSYVLASASRDEQALAMPDEPYTAFTGELLRFLHEGDPGGPPGLTLEGTYRHLRRVLPLRHLPAPERHLSGRAGDLVLAANPVAAPLRTPPATHTRPERLDEQVCPYPGLVPFTADDARFFFGRAPVTAEFLTRLADWSQDGGPVALVGLSGAGKSSLLRAGLLPAVRRGELPLPGAGTWPQFILTPGEHPLNSLASQLAGPTGYSKAELTAELRADPTRSAGLIRRALRRQSGDEDVPGGRLLIVVDQFEELFTACQDEDERRSFITAICSAAASDEAAVSAPALVLLGIRADFYASCLAYPELVGVLKHRQFPVEPMTPEQLREAIEKPAEVAGLELEADLADTLLRDLRADREFAGGTLPLLAYALLLTWGCREDRTLTLAGYGATGGIWDAITQQADHTYDNLTPGARRAAKLMLLRMVRISESTEDTRRRLNLTDLLAQRPPDEAAHIAAARDALAGARLITLDGDSAQIAHEALLRAWDRLRDWIDTSRAVLLVQQKLLDAAESWERDGRNPSGLYRGSQLELVRDQFGGIGQSGSQLGELAVQFFAASVRADRRRRRLRTGTVVTLILLLVASLLATGFAVKGRRDAQKQQRSAIAEALVRDADSARASDPRLALQLGIAADRLDHSPATTANLLSSLFAPYASTLSGHSAAVAGAAFAPGGRTLATASQDGTVILWDTSDPPRARMLGRPLPGPSYGVYTVAFSHDGHVLAAGGGDNAGHTVQMWDVSSPGRPRRLGQPLTGPANVHTMGFTPDGRTLAAGAADGKVWFWDTSHPEHARPLGQPLTAQNADTSSMAFRPDGHVLVTGSINGTAVLWDVTDRAHPRRLKNPISHSGGVSAIGFTPNGRTLVIGGGDGKADLWNASDPSHPTWVSQISAGDAPVKALEVFPHEIDVALADHYSTVWDTSDPVSPRKADGAIVGASNWTGAVAFAPHADLLATGSPDNTVILWEGRADNGHVPLLARLGGNAGGVQAMTLRPDGRAAATGGADGKVTLWDLTDPKHPKGITPKTARHGDRVFGMAFSPDGRTLASGSLDHTVILWDAADLHRLRKIKQFTANDGGVDGLAFSPVGHTLATVGGNAAITLWDTSAPSRPRQIGRPLTGHRTGVDAVAFSPDGRTLATGSWDGTAILWDIDNLARPHQLGKPLAGHTNWVSSVAFSPDGHTLATGSLDSSIILWDTTDPAKAHHLGPPLVDHGSWVLGLAFGPDSRTLVSGSADHTSILWDVTDPVHPYDLGVVGSNHTDAVTSVAISADDRTLLTASADGTVNLNSLAELNDARMHALDLACTRAAQGLSAEQWARYVPGLKYQRTC
ncbi:caspase family protein [Streptomyces sp. NPDC051658]|uniref:caspase, EACC1-associated type n=1 Tax=Streptomyces sp. NPDC051658 TaxID=3365667 RepID=UPI00379CA77A